MKIGLILLSALVLYSTSFAQEYSVKFTGSYLNAPSIASEMIIDKDNPALKLEGYEGMPGYEVKAGLAVSRIEFNFISQRYKAKKEENSEKGEIIFTTESACLLLYAYNASDLSGFNAHIGIGKGITHLKINTEQNGNPVIEDGVAYAKEMHGEIGFHYGLTESTAISLNYLSQIIKAVTGENFTNSMVTLSAYYLF
jgi:hypothetical protein